MTSHTDELFATRDGDLPVIGIFRGHSPERTVELCRAAWDNGVRLVEIPLTGTHAVTSLAAAVAAADGRPVGAGTALSAGDVARAVSAGAEFIVSPGLHPEVVKAAQHLDVPCLPGVATATEIAQALTLGCRWQKAFPARQLGAEWVTAQLAPFPDVRFVATGGVDISNAPDFLRAGCRAVAVGSAFSSANDVEELKRALAPFVNDATVRSSWKEKPSVARPVVPGAMEAASWPR